LFLFEVGNPCGDAFGPENYAPQNYAGLCNEGRLLARRHVLPEAFTFEIRSSIPETAAHLLPDLEVDVSGELEVARSRRTGNAADLPEV
jgi:hypothetical protein